MLDLEAAAGALPQPFTSAAARSVGLSRDVLARGLRRGLLIRLAHGAYVLARVWDDAGLRGQHLLLVAAASSQRPGSCVTHHSAALVHGLPMPIDCPPFVSLTTDRTRRTSAARAPDRLRNAALPMEHVMVRDRLAVTTPGRTVIDCLRELPLPDAVAVADAAVRQGLTTVRELEVLRRQQRHWPGVRAADDGIALIDPCRETWLESWSFARLWQLGVPMPQSQVEVYDVRGRLLGRVDGLWARARDGCRGGCAGKYSVSSTRTARAGRPRHDWCSQRRCARTGCAAPGSRWSGGTFATSAGTPLPSSRGSRQHGRAGTWPAPRPPRRLTGTSPLRADRSTLWSR